MLRRDRDLDDVPEGQRVYSPSRRKVAAFWEAARREDRYDDDTTWFIRAWDTQRKLSLALFVHTDKCSHMTGVERGGPVERIAFLDEDRLEVRYGDDTCEVHQVPDEPRPPPTVSRADLPEGWE